MELKILPLSGDGFHQKCYLSKQMLVQLQAKIAHYVLIKTGRKSCVCSIWPKADIGEQALSLNETVCYQENITSDLNHSNSVTLLHPVKAVTVQVSVILKSIDRCIALKKDTALMKGLEGNVFSLLQKLCIGKHFIVNCETSQFARLLGVSLIVVEEVHGLNTDNTDSFVLIDSKNSVLINKVHSLEWYKQINVDKPLLKLGGLDSVVNTLRDLIRLPRIQKHNFKAVGVRPPRGILLRGPPGCGKTSLVQYLAQEEKVFLIAVNGSEMFGPLPGETESNIRNLFNKARAMSEEGPCILFFDEIDSICPKESKSGGVHESRATVQLLALMDGLKEEDFLIIAATNRPSALDSALRRPGRFDREVLIGPPDMSQRHSILSHHTASLPVATDLDLNTVAMVTNGYVGADLVALCQEASYLAITESHLNEGDKLIYHRHFEAAIKKVRPSLQKGAEGMVDLRPVQWEDIGGLDSVKLQIQQAVEWPIKHPEAFKRMGLQPPRGVLLYGPPGCCKTTLVKAAATACHSTFLSISGAQLYSPYVGDSERLLSEVFQKARTCAPSILFLDEIDSIIGKRSDKGNHGIQGRILSMLLNEMDGVGVRLDDGAVPGHRQKLLEGSSSAATQVSQVEVAENKCVLLVAATNRPDLLDEALLRPGRIDRIVYVPHPDQEARKKILEIYTRNMTLASCDLDDLASRTDMFTGADLESLCREAALCALTEDINTSMVTMEHFIQALQAVSSSLTPDIIRQYSNINFRTVR